MYLSPVFYFLDFIMPENGSVGKIFYMFYSDNKEVISMKQVERYFYPAVFTYEPGQEIAVDFPDPASRFLCNRRVTVPPEKN